MKSGSSFVSRFKLLFLALALSAIGSMAFAANAVEGSPALDRPNAISFELLGRAALYSFNFDHSISDSVGVGAGIGYLSISATSTTSSASATLSLLIIPTYVNYYFQPGPHRGFLSGGLDLVLASGSVTDASNNSSFSASAFSVAPVIGGGYEYRSDGGFLFRAAPYLIIGKSVAVWAGLSFGFTF